MASSMIAEKVMLARRYVRAVDMARDLRDPTALDGYVVTPSVRDGLIRVIEGVRLTSTQRAFRVTGPYGSGKSSFGLLLARIFEEGGSDGPATRILGEVVGTREAPRYLPIVLVGRRTSLSDELLRALMHAAATTTGNNENALAQATELLHRRTNGHRDVNVVLDLLSAYARDLANKTGYGLLLLIDEMGRYVEFAAANPAREDPSIFQLLAERAGGSASPNLAVISFLHHRFGDYVAGLGDWMEGEWARSSERYEEIAFQESTEQTLHLMAQALCSERPHSPRVRKAAAALYRDAADRRLFAASKSAIQKAAERLYPLHPAAIACLAATSRRFGQNERSVFSFLQSLEPGGFRRFAHENAYGADTWYRVDHLYDYLAAQNSFRFRSADRERRWQLALDAVTLCRDATAVQLSVIKTLSVLAVLEPVSGLKSDPATIAWCLGADQDEVKGALSMLVKRGVAHGRAAQGDYSLWSHTSVDLDRWFQDAQVALPATTRLDDQLQALPKSRPLIAHRHYHRTGTMRIFRTFIGEAPAAGGDEDGSVIVLPVHPEEELLNVAERARQLSLIGGPLALVRTRRITATDLARTHELACWRWVRTNCIELRIDDIARAEVDRRIASLEKELLRLLAPFSDPTHDAADELWFHNGKSVEVGSRAELSRLLSDICDGVFKDAPELRNELINRDRLSTAIAAARMRLLELMLTNPDEEYLGLRGAPPERTIYLSLFHESGMHREAGGKFEFLPLTSEEDPKRWRPTWEKIDRLVRGGEAIRFDQLVAELGKPPIGLRAGPALLVISAYMLHNRRTMALMERNTFQPEIAPAHFMRLAKNPANFALRHISVSDSPAMLQALVEGLAIWSEAPPAPELKAVVEALYRWWGRLSDYAKSTLSLDKRTQIVRSVLRKARDPVELIFRALPEACEAERDGAIDPTTFVSSLDIALTQMAEALPALRKRATASVIGAFGVQSVAKLRQQIEADYQDHLLELGDHSLRAFVDRAMNSDLSEEAWLDGVASLVVGRRLEAWRDDTHDSFGFEVRALAQRLARRLAQIRQSKAQAAPITGVHLTAPDGTEQSMFVRTGSGAGETRAGEIRKLLHEASDPDALLLELLAERMAAHSREIAR